MQTSKFPSIHKRLREATHPDLYHDMGHIEIKKQKLYKQPGRSNRRDKGRAKRLIRDLITKSWNASRFMEGGRRMKRQRALKTFWSEKRFVDSDPKTGPTVDFS
jgi:hypothetical protein